MGASTSVYYPEHARVSTKFGDNADNAYTHHHAHDDDNNHNKHNHNGVSTHPWGFPWTL